MEYPAEEAVFYKGVDLAKHARIRAVRPQHLADMDDQHASAASSKVVGNVLLYPA
jgi:hypothetical protein